MYVCVCACSRMSVCMHECAAFVWARMLMWGYKHVSFFINMQWPLKLHTLQSNESQQNNAEYKKCHNETDSK